MDYSKWVAENLIAMVMVGSRMYGTANENSDIDMRGVCLEPPMSVLGIHRFEQYTSVCAEDDLVIYSVAKFLRLAKECNPSILDILFAPRQFVLHATPGWASIYEKRHLFLSQKVRRTFSGYAYSQLKRIKGHKRWLDDPPPVPEPEDFGLYLRSTEKGGQGYALLGGGDRSALVAEYKKALAERKKYDEWRANRNPERAALEEMHGYDTKHAAHLMRLLLQGVRILKTGDYNPVIDKFDMSAYIGPIMSGDMPYETLLVYAEEYDKLIMEMDSTLPLAPDTDAIDDILVRFAAKSLAASDDIRQILQLEVCNDE